MDVTVWLWIWVAVICISAIVEFATMQMVSIWFVGGGLVALILYFCGVGWEIQLIVCLVVTIVLLLSCRKLCMKFLLKGTDEKTNVDSLVGKEVKLLKGINVDEAGEVKVNDVIWTAVAQDSTNIEVGNKVRVVAVQGNKLIVQKLDAETTANAVSVTTEQEGAQAVELVSAEPVDNISESSVEVAKETNSPKRQKATTTAKKSTKTKKTDTK